MQLRDWLNEEEGRREALAKALKVTVFAVNQWLQRRVPSERCLAIETHTKGAVTRYEMRPNIYGAPVPDNSQNGLSEQKAA